jgi:CBS domain-containing protein
MKAGEACSREVVAIPAGADLLSAAQLMREKHVGFLVVTESLGEDRPPGVCGVLTDRDIVVAVVAKSANPAALRVADVMTRNPLMIGEDHSVDAALEFMRTNGVRRVPVLNAHRHLTGVLSVDDILDTLATQLTRVAETAQSEQRIEYFVR